jgi:hypothetical protein
LDLDLESDAPVAKKPYNVLHEASYAMDAPAGNRRVLAHAHPRVRDQGGRAACDRQPRHG